MKDSARFVKRGLAFIPESADARALAAKVPDGKSVFLELWMPRNMAQHRKFFAILRNVVEATGRWTSQEHLRRDILLTLGRYDEHVNEFTGEVEKVVHSMAVASMPREEFQRLYEDTIKLLTDALGADPELLVQEAA